MAYTVLKTEGRNTYAFDPTSGNYYYLDSGSGNYSSTNWGYKLVTDANKLKELEAEYKRQQENTERLSRMQTPLGNPKKIGRAHV